jgi:SAM-dependent methyltransferase
MNQDLATAMDAVAPFYELDLDGFADDLTLYEGFAKRTDGDVLDVGCGTGRVAAALARSGKRVMAVDVSEAMLTRAAQYESFETLHGDLRSLHLDRRFGLAIAPLGTLHHVATGDRVAAFASIRRHLVPGGLFVADLSVESDWSPGLQPLIAHWTRSDPRSGHTVTKLVAIESDPTSLTQQVTYFFDEVAEDGSLRRSVAMFDLFYFSESEITLLTTQNGMEIESIYGDYDLSPLAAESERMIVVARAV